MNLWNDLRTTDVRCIDVSGCERLENFHGVQNDFGREIDE